jgi:acetyltransferase-like isoleucine patch superfamily enzyme
VRIPALLLSPLSAVYVLSQLTAELRARRELIARNQRLTIGRWVEVRSPERLHLGKGITLDSGALVHCGGMDWSGGEGGVWIGDDTYIGPHSILFGAGEIRIGKGVLISPGVVISSHQHTFSRRELLIRDQPAVFSPVVIEDNVWIGSNATILPGVTIGSGTVVGAGAVVTKSLPGQRLALGVPARVVRTL